ncbi:DNA-methyltransferase [Oceanobacillus sojae]|uniref:DNA-methyltransferase n=1 Tax=Oceanobacillus sojae TaxID=582851 RepID=UPI0009884710|nr:site-specific DNA-methyltransferase [Oceanobacillus sojae]
MEKYINEIICGDNVEVLRKFPDNSVDLTVTSPPYDNLRTYGGFEWDFEGIAKELYRVTKDGGVVVWVVGDATINGSETGTSFRQALHFKELGFNIHDTMIYKKNKVPVYDPRHHRYKNDFEYMFIFSKGKPKTFIPIKDVPVKSSGQKTRVQQRLPDGSFRKDRVIRRGDWQARGAIWEYVTGVEDKIAYNHPAIFPEKLAEDHIVSWSNPGDIVLDPFVGSGTTAKMAYKLDRKYIGIDISEEYCGIARSRIPEKVEEALV